MNLDELIDVLTKIRMNHGGDQPVVIAALYSQSGQVELVRYQRDDKSSSVEILTDLYYG